MCEIIRAYGHACTSDDPRTATVAAAATASSENRVNARVRVVLR